MEAKYILQIHHILMYISSGLLCPLKNIYQIVSNFYVKYEKMTNYDMKKLS